MNKEDSYRKERIKTNDGTTIDIIVSEDDVLIEEENGSVLYAGSNWIRLDWESWNKVSIIVRRLKSNTNMKIIKEKKISGFLKSEEEIRIRLVDELIEIEDVGIRRDGKTFRLGNIYLYKEEWEEVRKCIDELIEETTKKETL